MDFFEDVLIGLQREMANEGVTLPLYSKSDAVITLARCAEYKMRRIGINKRTVQISNHLKNSIEYARHKAAIDNLEKLSELGSDVSPYQSKTIDRFEYSELLLFDWGIQHLHLGTVQSGQQFSSRTGPLLFAMYKNTEAYFIAILDHGKWAELDLLNIVESDWPQLLDPYTIKGISGISPIPTQEETLELRKAGVMTMQQLASGRILSSIGGGITTAKTSVRAMTEAQQLARLLHRAEDAVIKDEQIIRKKIKATSGERIRLLDLSLTQATVACEETKTKTIISL